LTNTFHHIDEKFGLLFSILS